MVKNPVAVSTKLSLRDTIKLMDGTKVSHVLVNDEDNNLKGVISKADILKRMKVLSKETTGETYSTLFTNSLKASDVMTPEPITVKPDDSIEYGVELLLQKEFHCLPVVENGKSIGIVTFYDLLKGYYEHYG